MLSINRPIFSSKTTYHRKNYFMKFFYLTFSCLFSLSIQSQSSIKNIEPYLQSKKTRVQENAILSPGLYARICGENLNHDLIHNKMISKEEVIQFNRKNKNILSRSENILIRIIANDLHMASATINSLGFQETARAVQQNRIIGTIPVSKLSQLAVLKNPSIRYIEEVQQPKKQTGSVNSQADTIMGTYKIKDLSPGIDGDGVKIGILSDSFDDLGGMADGQASADLPDSVTIVQDYSGGSDEGRAMAELIYDLAPGAELVFATAFGGQESFAKNIDTLAKLGCKVIVDDVIYFAEPFFQNGIIAQKVNEVFNTYDVAYFSSAGNSGNNSYESQDTNYVASPSQPSYQFFDFDSGPGEDIGQSIILNQDEEITIAFQWDDPFYTLSGVDTDVDIFLVNSGTGTSVSSSVDDNIASGIPFEFISYTNPGPTDTFFLAIGLFSGPKPEWIKFINYGGGQILDHPNNAPTIVGHAAAQYAIAVGAVPYFSLTPEPFTSLGPSTILFEDDGTPKPSPEIRNKPEIAAIDGTNNTFFGFDIGDPDTFPNFFGTSAAAPHAAALAALICESLAGVSSTDLRDILLQGAIDIGAPGFDFLSGYGLVHAMSSCLLNQLHVDNPFLADIYQISPRLAIKQTITSDGTIQAGREFIFDAGESITLNSGFEVQLNALFEALIKTCPD